MNIKLPRNIRLPYKLEPLRKHSRFKAVYGGRGGGKSWGIAINLILRCLKKKTRVLCCREIQSSIDESVHKLLSDTIKFLGVESYFTITDKRILCKNGSHFTFIGIRQNITKLKSYEGYDICWVEESQSVTQKSLDILIPTIRKTEKKLFKTFEELLEFLDENPDLKYKEYLLEDDIAIELYNKYIECNPSSNIFEYIKNKNEYICHLPSEIWFSFNPDNESDPIYKKFVINKPDSCIRIEINYPDNPDFPATLRKEMEDCKRDDKEAYLHTWLGRPTGGGALIYGKKFNSDIHVIDKTKEEIFELIAKKGNAFHGMDPHLDFYPFSVWLAIIPKEGAEGYIKVIYNEFPTYDYFGDWYFEQRNKKRLDISLSQLTKLHYAQDGSEYGIQIINRFADTRFVKSSGGASIITGTPGLIETFKRPENGGMILNCPPEKFIDVQRMNVLTDLEYNKHLPISIFNQPNLYVCPWCKNVINALRLHRENLTGTKEDEKHKDITDALRILYAGIVDHRFIDRERKNTGKKIYYKSSF